MSSGELRIEHPNHAAEDEKFSALALRLGVEEVPPGEPSFRHLTFNLSNGQVYDLIEIMHALLDRIDAASE